MYVINPSSLTQILKCSKTLARYLIKHDIPILSNKDEYYYFADTKELHETIDNAPFYIKWFAGN